MKTRQKAIIVATGNRNQPGLEDLNQALDCGWRVVHMIPMGHTSEEKTSDVKFAALVVIENGHTGSFDALEDVKSNLEALVERN